VAGEFYAGSLQELESEVVGLLTAAPAYAGGRAKALIAPHAGYAYSGKVAAAAFAALREIAETITRVVVIGPAHFVALRGIAVPTVEAFETPLGRIVLDRDALAALADLPYVVEADGPHAPEHPFLQTLLGPFALLPLVVGGASPREVADVLRRLWGGPETLLVISSDLSHYHDYRTARQLDAATAAAIERGDWEQLHSGSACGRLPIAGLLHEAVRRGLTVQRRALCNSGDTAGDHDQVVGYGAWAFAEPAFRHFVRIAPRAEAVGLNPNQCGFESRCGYALIAQLAEAADSNPACCRFESCSAHHLFSASLA
jgi:MEMO1 family protein